MRSNLFVLIILLIGNCVTAQPLLTDEPIGFASLDGCTTGGRDGEAVLITEAQQLVDIMKPREKNIVEPLILYISGTLTGLENMVDFKRTGNISLLGLGTNAKLLGFGIKLVESSNIIVQNIEFADCRVEEKDALTIDRCHNIWIDHCSFSDNPSIDPARDFHDGLLDIKKGSYNVTISNNYFTNHRTVGLVGHSTKQTDDVNIKVTYYRNWFDGTYSRHPRVRYGTVHMLNNLYTDITGYAVGITCAAQVLIEGNYFKNTAVPVLISQVNDPEKILSGDPVGYTKSIDNYMVSSGTIVENLSEYNFDPAEYYTYTPDEGEKVMDIVKADAGSGKLEIFTAVVSEDKTFPSPISLSENYPNPFNPTTRIEYEISNISMVTINIYNMLGEKIETLIHEQQFAGKHWIDFHPINYSSGIYYYQLSAEGNVTRKKMLLLK
ncbi:T9SS type A sorting domain-containing protein [candidate division KSB1 bacterium]|nr:T9SS type A sorting domain-containing protein [candidate division KSB1 bacterium]